MAHKRSFALSLVEYFEQNTNRNEALVATYRSGAYTMEEIAVFCVLHDVESCDERGKVEYRMLKMLQVSCSKLVATYATTCLKTASIL